MLQRFASLPGAGLLAVSLSAVGLSAVSLTVLGLSAPVAQAQTAPEADPVDALYDALALAEIIAVMREEGFAYGDDLAQDLFVGPMTDRLSEEWGAIVGDIYDTDWMAGVVRNRLGAALEGHDVAPMVEFFTTSPGAEMIRLEVSARRALLDDDVMEAAKEAAALAIADNTPRYQLIRRLVEANDLVEMNVVGAMNSNVSYFMGLFDGAVPPDSLSQDEVIADVWLREAEIRAFTTEWVYAFLLMAYQPLSEDEIEAYIAFSATEAGRALNRAVFAAFDEMFDDVSFRLGLVSSRFMLGMEL